MAHWGGLHIVAAPLLAGVALEATRLTPRSVSTRLPPIRRWLTPLLHLSIAAILLYAVLAFLRPALTEWVESGVAAMARNWLAGLGMYPAHPPPGRLSVYPYGPLLFQLIGALYAVSAGNAAIVKAAFIGSAAMSYALLFTALRRQGASVTASALSVEIFAVIAGIMAVMVKADGLLIALAILAILVRTWRTAGPAQWFSLCALAGIAAAIKVHGVFYIAPAALECLLLWRGQRLFKLAGGALVAAAIAAAPFLIPGTSLPRYILVLRTAAQDGLLFGIFVSNLAFIATCAAAVHMLVPDWARDAAYRRRIGLVLFAGLCVSIFAAKDEAGPHHLIPLLPYLCLPLARALEQRGGARQILFLTLFLLSFQPITGVAGDAAKMLAHWWTPAALL